MPPDRQPHTEPGPVPQSDRQPQPSIEDDNPMLHCPVCNQRLISRRCKLICERCGYYMSCADYY
jgi:hypothetical protein